MYLQFRNFIGILVFLHEFQFKFLSLNYEVWIEKCLVSFLLLVIVRLGFESRIVVPLSTPTTPTTPLSTPLHLTPQTHISFLQSNSASNPNFLFTSWTPQWPLTWYLQYPPRSLRISSRYCRHTAWNCPLLIFRFKTAHLRVLFYWYFPLIHPLLIYRIIKSSFHLSFNHQYQSSNAASSTFPSLASM